MFINIELVRVAALLHDIARIRKKDHAGIGARLLESHGFARLAPIVGAHMDLAVDARQPMDEAQVVYLADVSQGSFQGWIYLLRHGAVRAAGSGKRYIGTQDLALSDAGLGQAGAWADFFANLSLEEIYCSDLIRCLETARIIGARCGVEPQAMLELREVRLGAWEGQRFDTVKTLDPHAFQARGDHIADHRPPGGESFRDLQERAWPIFEAVVRQRRNQTLIVTHAGVIRVLLCRLLGMPLDNLFCIGQAYGALNIIQVRPAGYCVQAINTQPPE